MARSGRSAPERPATHLAVFLSRIPDGPLYSHRYAADGDDVVTVRAISRGCRGGDAQVGVGTFTYSAF